MADDFAGNAATTGTLPIEGTVSGSIETSADSDWFAATLLAGHTYTFDLRGVDGSGGTIADPLMRLIDSADVVLRTDDDGGIGLDSQIAGFVAPYTGTFYISAQAFASGTGTYSLTATLVTAPPDDYAGNPGTTGVLTVGPSGTGTIDYAGDTDWFAINLMAGNTYSFGLFGAGSGSGSLGDPFLRLLDGSGTELSGDDDGGAGLDARISGFIAPYSGTYYLSAQAFTTASGTYSIASMQTASAAQSATDLYLDAIHLSQLVYQDAFDPSYGLDGGAGQGWRLVSGAELGATGSAADEFIDQYLEMKLH
jgi:hypothetical protein